MKKEISVASVAKRMIRILTTYHEQVRETEIEVPEQSTSTSTSTSEQISYSTAHGLESHKKLLNFAAQADSESESDSDSSDQSYSLIDSPPARCLRSKRTKIRATKRTAAKCVAGATKRKQRKITSTTTATAIITSDPLVSNSSATESDRDTNATIPVSKTTKRHTRSNATMPAQRATPKKTTPKKSTPIKATPIKASGSFNENDNRQATN